MAKEVIWPNLDVVLHHYTWRRVGMRVCLKTEERVCPVFNANTVESVVMSCQLYDGVRENHFTCAYVI